MKNIDAMLRIIEDIDDMLMNTDRIDTKIIMILIMHRISQTTNKKHICGYIKRLLKTKNIKNYALLLAIISDICD